MKRGRRTDRTTKDRYERMAAQGQGGSTLAGQPDPLRTARSLGYSEDEVRRVPQGALEMGLGCGHPTGLAELRPGQAVLDLGCGGGLDVFVAAQKVGPAGKVIGVDMTPGMIERARQFAAQGGFANVDFRVGRIEQLPLPDECVDVIISNCVINHSPDKPAVFREARRVLKRGGWLYVSDLTVEGPAPRADQPGMEVWSAWLGFACGKGPYLAAIEQGGFAEIIVASERAYDGPGMVEALKGKIVSLHVKARK